MLDSSGFYSFNDSLFYAPNFVYFPDGTSLLVENKDNYSYPDNGWYWFDSEEAAKLFFNIEEEKTQEQ